MKEYPVVKKTFIKSSNSSNKILFRYSISLIIFFLYILSCYLIKKDYSTSIALIKTFIVSLSLSTIFQYIINIVRKNKQFLSVFKEDNVIANAIIITLFSYKEQLIVIILASIISIIIKLFSKNIGLSSSLYGILFIIIYQKINGYSIELDSYTNILKDSEEIIKTSLGLTFNNLSPILSIILLGYLFHKKSIKYPIIFSYLITYISLILIYSLITGNGLLYFIQNIISSNIIFLAVFTLIDYKITPISYEGGVIYGLITAILTLILSTIDINLAPVIVFIISPIIITKYIDIISYKLKYNPKFYKIILASLVFISFIILLILYILKK